ncbi:MAG TPA: polyprenyl synthetase family protein [Gemmatales bacterium]|nr:polyprenyl synthetase family protein [Gemmatales bacterium]
MSVTTAAVHDARLQDMAKPSAEWRADSFFYQPIAAELMQTERLFEEELNTRAPYVKDLIKHLAHYRGKRLRPTLLLLTAKATGELRREHPMLAAVVEMIHTATLVHDDVLDSADLRRHVATINARWGNASSVLLGDLLFTHAFHLASKTGSAEACRIIGEATNKVCEGELHQIGEQGNLNLPEVDYYAIIQGKTAALTACCCELGALFAGAQAEQVRAMKSFGNYLGIAFQVADDVLDLVGIEKEAGKSLGTDVLQKKLTLPLIHLLQQGNRMSEEARDILDAPSERGIHRLRYLLTESGSVGYAQAEAERFVHQAREILKILPANEAATTLDQLTQRIVQRKS